MRDDTLRRCALLVDTMVAISGGRLVLFLFWGAYYIFLRLYHVLAAPVERPTTDVRAVDILKYIYPG